jgi:hypothetical protein
VRKILNRHPIGDRFDLAVVFIHLHIAAFIYAHLLKERISIYADARLWDETLTSLAELQRTNPQDRELKAEWTDVLRAIGLTEAVPETWTTYSLPAQHKNSRKTK